MSCVLPSWGVAMTLPPKSLAVLLPKTPPGARTPPAAGAAGHDYELVAFGFDVAVDRRAGTYEGRIHRIGEDRFYGRGPGVERDPLDSSPQFVESTGGPRIKRLRVSEISKVTEPEQLPLWLSGHNATGPQSNQKQASQQPLRSHPFPYQ